MMTAITLISTDVQQLAKLNTVILAVGEAKQKQTLAQKHVVMVRKWDNWHAMMAILFQVMDAHLHVLLKQVGYAHKETFMLPTFAMKFAVMAKIWESILAMMVILEMEMVVHQHVRLKVGTPVVGDHQQRKILAINLALLK